MRYLLLHPSTYRPATIASALEADQVVVQPITGPAELKPGSKPTVFILDHASRGRFFAEALESFVEAGGAVVLLGGDGELDIPDTYSVDLFTAFLRLPVAPRQVLCALRNAYRQSATRTRSEGLANEVKELTRAGIALAAEHDLETLLSQILNQSQRITNSDAGSLYLVEPHADGPPTQLRFVLAQGESRPDAPFKQTTMPINASSMAGYVTLSGEPLVIKDAYEIPDDVEYRHNRFFDDTYNYRTKSMLTLPMKDRKDTIIGVLQLINRKRTPGTILESLADFDREVIPYTGKTVALVSALAAQAAVSIENSRLYADIETLFEGFVKASVTAIEQRDPTTSGHSGRVADLTVALAKVADRADGGKFRDVTFTREQLREIRYASLLHDFGKVGVREQVLVKAKKLYPMDIQLIRQRYAFVRRTAERNFHLKRAQYLEEHGRDGYDTFLTGLREALQAQIAELEHFIEVVEKANEPAVLATERLQDLERFGARRFEGLDGVHLPMLTDDEFRFLSIKRGSLDDDERLEIESHVSHTYAFLRQIPWTRELRDVPAIAYGHHEKLDGSGYPQRLLEDEIPVQSRMMTVSDIFDALTASDRPYKAALPVERALDILGYEVRDGHIDSELFDMFLQAKVFEVTRPKTADA